MRVRVRAEGGQGRRGHPDRAVRMLAGAPAADLAKSAVHPVDGITVRPASGELREVAGDGR
jgi:hypothetical protein